MSRFAPVLLLLAALLPGCASTRAISSWQLPLSAPHPRFHHLYVIALVPLDPVGIRLEQALVGRLRDEGVAATAGRTHFTEQELRDPAARARVAAAVRAAGADGVLLVAFRRATERQIYVPPASTTVALPPPTLLPDGSPAYIGPRYDVIYEPGYYTTSTAFFMESSLFPAGKEVPVWRADSATVDPASIPAGVRSFTRALVDELRRSGALAPRAAGSEGKAGDAGAGGAAEGAGGGSAGVEGTALPAGAPVRPGP